MSNNNIPALLKTMKEQFDLALPKHMKSEKFIRTALTLVSMNPKLKECTSSSLLGGFMQAAQDGFDFTNNGQCYLIPRYNKHIKGFEANYQRGYQGVLSLVRRTGEINRLEVNAVYENDFFDFEEGSTSLLKFKRKLFDRGELIGFYALTDTGVNNITFTIMSVMEIEEHRDQFSVPPSNMAESEKANYKGGKIWRDSFVSMALKTVLLQHLKFLPKSVELLDKLLNDDSVIDYDLKKGGIKNITPAFKSEDEEKADAPIRIDPKAKPAPLVSNLVQLGELDEKELDLVASNFVQQKDCSEGVRDMYKDWGSCIFEDKLNFCRDIVFNGQLQ